MFAGAGLQRVNGSVCAFIDTVGVAVWDKPHIKDGFNQVTQGMMHHPVTERCGADFSALRLVDVEMMIRAGAIRPGVQFCLKLNQLIRDFMFKICRWDAPTLALRRFAVC